ncbi:alpha/beta hydrolase fold domain-containing protein [Streptomyces gardneri]|uniref:alpha/beta hydrolase fold domain-containing protein n=1 Tax=Nocardia TaxID=1817 RepID=UPI001359F5C8|nr:MULTISPECIES: alpha/beta hydrolase [Nocardia]MBF6165836.1 alpha/beta hydrolase fold domain-containing protein [Streptomyces gardneri]MBF6203159.1 alpha/beta hydrolase fold domain-containing protein [Streptomyces gardneri]UAK30011.1 alpha/beta hydrolase [Nocardia asteroides]
MPSLANQVVRGYLKATRANRVFVDADAAHERILELSVRPRNYGPPRRLRADVAIEVDRRGGWPVYTLTPPGRRVRGNVVYAHGGGWVHEIAPQHWALCAAVAAEAGAAVTVAIYPLIPFGTAAQVVQGFVELVLANRETYGNVCLAGDSAGGQIALSSALVLRDDHGVRLPGTLLIAPALDLSLTNPEIEVVQPRDPWLGVPGTRVLIEHWRGDLEIADPRVSPLVADLRGLGPLTVFCGTDDILHPDSCLLVDAARGAGVAVDYHEGRGLPHVYPLTPTPEGRAARGVIIERIRSALAE